MSIERHRATWRSITFNQRYADAGLAPDNPDNLTEALLNSDYYLDSCDPTRVSVQDYRELRQFLEGAEPNEAYEGVRALNGIGRIVGATYADLEDKTWAMFEAFSVAATRIAAQTADPVGLLPFSFKRDTAPAVGIDGASTAKALRFYCRPGPGRPVIIGRRQGGLVRPFSFQLIAFDPFAYDETQTLTIPPLGGGNVTNPGNIYTRPKIRFNFNGAGSATLTINNTTTGKTFVLNASTAAVGESWELDVARGVITRLSDGANRYSQRVSGYISDMWLAAGVNAFTFANTANVIDCQVRFRGAYA
ncbi:MAG TPA: hypothetical protein VIU37_10725 [Candidatus Limnocylindrales bacterium]